VMPWWIFVFVSSSSPAGVSPVRVAARSLVAGWRLGLETGRSEPSVKSPCGGSDDAVRSMTRSLRRRYSAVRVGGQGSAEPLEIGAKAMEAAKSLEAQS
jgi:hypothetical protein